MNVNDLTGQRFGRLVALAPTEERHKSSIIWLCHCDCGKDCKVPSYWLRHNLKRSCGCLQDENRRTDIAGQKRGHLTAIRPTDQRRNGSTVWEWRCDCGATVYKAVSMVQGKSKSTMCPACSRKLKRAHARAMVENQKRDDETGVMLGALPGIRNGKLFRNNSSGVRGVSWHAGTGKWVARMQRDDKTVTLGYFSSIEEAAKARKAAVLLKYGPPDKSQK